MKAFISTLMTLCLLLFFSGGDLYAQFGRRLGEAIKRRAEDAATRKAEQKTEEAVDKATDPDTYKNDGEGDEEEEEEEEAAPSKNKSKGKSSKNAKKSASGQTASKNIEMVYAKSDFVPGDEIFFEDNVNEQMGEFPSQWDLLEGSAEVAEVAGAKCISVEPGAKLAPLMKDMKNYLPDVFTVEFDFWVNDKNGKVDQQYEFMLYHGDGRYGSDQSVQLIFANPNSNSKGRVQWSYKTPSDESRSGEGEFEINENSWHHFAVSFNKRAFKAYINGIRIVNVPSMMAPRHLAFYQSTWGGITPGTTAIKNIRMAKGAVPLYDRMMADGKFISYGITFDVGKSVIRPESMGEVNRIVKLMTDNPDLKFSVEGHTDSTGNAASNQTLSDARSKAVVDKLVALGISADRLQSAGKGQSSPIADNATDEGRAKNRRVEFVKIS